MDNQTMNNIIIVKLDVTKLLKEHFFKGAKGTYADLALLPSKDSRYGDDFMVVQSVSKEKREAGEKGPIVGNARFLKPKAQEPAKTGQAELPAETNPGNDDVPF